LVGGFSFLFSHFASPPPHGMTTDPIIPMHIR
jgi:hypothetical protein